MDSHPGIRWSSTVMMCFEVSPKKGLSGIVGETLHHCGKKEDLPAGEVSSLCVNSRAG